MTLRKWKKRIKKLCGENNVKFHIDRSTGIVYYAIRISEALTFVSNSWMASGIRVNKKRYGVK